jgi:hypothetical protein
MKTNIFNQTHYESRNVLFINLLIRKQKWRQTKSLRGKKL